LRWTTKDDLGKRRQPVERYKGREGHNESDEEVIVRFMKIHDILAGTLQGKGKVADVWSLVHVPHDSQFRQFHGLQCQLISQRRKSDSSDLSLILSIPSD